ncbi:MAG: hypothetical protein ABEH78_10090 [Haloferacaceae archaeon]
MIRVTADDRRVRVRVRPRRAFAAADFHPSVDEFKNAIVVPHTVFERLFPESDPGTETGYAYAAAVDADHRRSYCTCSRSATTTCPTTTP